MFSDVQRLKALERLDLNAPLGLRTGRASAEARLAVEWLRAAEAPSLRPPPVVSWGPSSLQTVIWPPDRLLVTLNAADHAGVGPSASVTPGPGDLPAGTADAVT